MKRLFDTYLGIQIKINCVHFLLVLFFFVETILLFGYCIRRFLMSHAVIGACGDFLFVFRRNPYECA